MKYDKQYFDKEYDKSGEGKMVSEARVRMLLKRDESIKRALDVGCGFGDVLSFLEKEGVETVGVDISDYALNKARRRVKADLYKANVGVDVLPFKKNTFDAVVLFDLVEHISSPDHVFNEVFRVLKKKGIVFITTPSDQGLLRKLLLALFPDDPTHVNVQNMRYWELKLQEAGFGGVEVKGCILHGFPPFYHFRNWLRERSLPQLCRPIMFPVTQLCGYLYIFGRR